MSSTPSPAPRPPIKRFEVTCVYSHPEANVDIILVHGLNGHPEKTWTAKNGVFWPTDLLPVSLRGAKARILVYGYNADVYAFGNDKSPSSDMIHQHAQTLVSGLAIERLSEDCENNAVIWVAHSLGGILVKRALELSNDLTSKSSDPSRSIYVSTYGIIFLGTPHTGADPAKWAMLLQGLADALIPKKLIDTEPHLVQTLRSNNETLQNINLHFLDIYQRFEIDMVHESVKTDLKGLRAFVVDQASASPQLPGVRYYGIEASHSSMCKFDSRNAPGYLNVATTIKTWVQSSPPVIESRWVAEQRARRQVRENEAKELLGIYEDPIVKPSQGSSANTPGRETELIELHKMLFDKKRRAEGTSAVLLQCLPGGGKSCLARQYVYTHLDDFPGGVFWVRAKSQEQLAAGFWDIARKVALKSSNNDGSAATPRDPQEFISVVTDWFAANHDWLLVLDGIQFDHSEELRRFIPDSKNTSLIYTSTERSVGGDHHFMNPQVIKIPLLSAREAQQLFLLELDKKSPTTEELKNSMELVQRMGFLPLVIHAVAQRLKATREPLAKFVRAYLSNPKLQDLGTYKAVVEQLKLARAIEALNLIRVLCFFSQHIPVEMITLGLKALDASVKTFEPATGRVLNNTIKILNRFALIERNEMDQVQSSQSSKGSRDFLSDELDVIKIHSVVQDFFVDSLRAEGILPQWLEQAIHLFRRSYQTANTRISNKPNAGLVGDYRSYEIHGKRLLDHLKRNEKKYPSLSEVREALEPCLQAIKNEIERRTKESSNDIAQGRTEAYQTSVFDRTSSSSDTGPETPGAHERSNSIIYQWGIESHKDPSESPISISHQSEVGHNQDDTSRLFPPPRIEDPGYDSDRDDTVPMTARPSQRTIRPDNSTTDSPAVPDSPGRRTKNRPARLDMHRTVKSLEKNRYHDSAGAWRAVNPSGTDPRVTHELAEAYIPKTAPAAPSRGRLSGPSQAEMALNQISKNSPPPARGGTKLVVHDRRRTSLPRRTLTDNGVYITAGNAVCAPSEAGNTLDTSSIPESTWDWSSDGPSVTLRPATPAVSSLQRFPHSIDQFISPAPSSPRLGNSSYMDRYPSPDTDFYRERGHEPQDYFGSRNAAPIYSRQTGPLPIDFVGGSSPHRQSRPHNYPQWSNQDYPHPPYPDESFVPSSMPEISDRFHNRTSHLGIFERDPSTYRESGYSSQPMSRDPSGGSTRAARRPSLAETEPPPDLSGISPHVPPTSYQRYENMRGRGNEGAMRSSPRLAFARRAQIERVDEWDDDIPDMSRSETIGVSRSGIFNPNAPIFLPRTQSQPPVGPSRYAPLSPLTSPRTAPLEGYHRQGGGSRSNPMSPTTSGGVRVGRRMIGFGDFPELVDYDLARERAERQRQERRAFEEGLYRGQIGSGNGSARNRDASNQRPRMVDINLPNQNRATSDMENYEKYIQNEGRRRGLSSPEIIEGLDLRRLRERN